MLQVLKSCDGLISNGFHLCHTWLGFVTSIQHSTAPVKILYKIPTSACYPSSSLIPVLACLLSHWWGCKRLILHQDLLVCSNLFPQNDSVLESVSTDNFIYSSRFFFDQLSCGKVLALVYFCTILYEIIFLRGLIWGRLCPQRLWLCPAALTEHLWQDFPLYFSAIGLCNLAPTLWSNLHNRYSF